MATLHHKIGKNSACYLGKAHEKDNYKTYEKRRLEDGVLPDKTSCKMDLCHNNIGLGLFSKRAKTIKKIYFYYCKCHKFWKDKKRDFLSCDNRIIHKDSLIGKC
jgi:hypothetical protein